MNSDTMYEYNYEYNFFQNLICVRHLLTPVAIIFAQRTYRLKLVKYRIIYVFGVKSGQIKEKTARFFEVVLKHFHDAESIDLKHVMLECSSTNGFSYMALGYTYKMKE